MTTEPPNPFYEPEDSFRVLYTYKEPTAECDLIANIAKPHPTGQNFTEVHWRPLVCSLLTSGETPPFDMMATIPVYRYVFDHLYELSAKRYDRIYTSIIGKITAVGPYGSAVEKWASGRVFCSTRDQYMGLVRRGTVGGGLNVSLCRR
jgi:hypothetical protein